MNVETYKPGTNKVIQPPPEFKEPTAIRQTVVSHHFSCVTF
jgi:hypothetical protein